MSDAAPPAAAPAKKAVKPKKPKKPAEHPTYSVMVAAAISALKERSGSSRQAVLKYIQANYKVGNETAKVNAHVKTCLKAGVKAGSLKQAKGTGASGSFRLGEKKPAPTTPKVKKAKKPKAPAKKPAAKKPKTAAKKPKSPAKKAVKKPKSPAKKPAAKKTAKPKKAATKSPKPKKAAKSPAKKAAAKKPAKK